MKFLNINRDNKKLITELNHHIKKKDPIFILFYMEGCGPCNAARPEWKKIENILEDKYKDRENYIIVDIDQSLMDGIEGLKDTPNAFPAIRYMKGRNYASYESNRDIDSFIKWIETNMKQSGGKLKRTKRNSRTRKRKQTRKRKYKRQNK
jgi:thiol-disulfide isomerase/thioredoxin